MTNWGQPWSNGDIETLARMRCQRKTYAECAAHLGRSEVSCRRKLSKLGMARGVNWTPYEDDYVWLSVLEGIPHKQIALELGRTPGRGDAAGVQTQTRKVFQ